MARPAYIKIDLAALKHNLALVRQIASGCKVIAMVKANAYGHGMVRVAHALQDVDAFGVASMDEGLRLREGGIQTPIVLMEGLFFPEELPVAAQNDFTLVVHHQQQLEILQQAKLDKPVPVWLKLNTGMNRLGIDPGNTTEFISQLNAFSAVQQPVGIMTHFAEADLTQSQKTNEQMQCFQNVTAGLTGPYSMANSAGILAWPESHADWVRPGLMLYGASPFADKTGIDHGLQPVMTLWSRLIAVNHVKKGGRVGYGGTWEAPRDMLVGVVGIGYGDGYPQFAQNGTPVLVNGKECQLVGRVSMDMLTVDLSNCPDAKMGDEVILWGAGLPVERVAQAANTSAYEVLTRITLRPKLDVHA